MQLYSLKAKFILIIILISMVVGLLTLLAFNTSTDSIIRDLALNFGTREALLEKNKIIAILDREVVLAQKMADDITLRRWVGAEENPEYKDQAFEEMESYRKLFRDKSYFVALEASKHYYVYKKGAGHERVKMVTLDAAKPSDGWFFAGLKDINGYALNLDYDPTRQEVKVWFNAVMLGAQGEKIGICGGGINITDFLNEIIHKEESGLTTILIDRTGVILAHKDQKIVEHNADFNNSSEKITIFSFLDNFSDQEELRSAIESLATGKSTVEAFPVKLDGKSYLLAASYMEGIGWLNIVLVDVSRVISMKEFLPIIVIMTLALFMAIVLIGVLINRLVLVPLARLSRASDEIAEGRYDIILPVTGHDELGDLTGSFNAMAATILDHTNNLESKVQERTDELFAANQLLKKSQQRITDSISYARRIQSSILPDQELLKKCLGEHFILYRPKEQVGGDFYYLRQFPNHFLLAVIDCTGHGIPGAFMTMTVNSVLNHVVDVLCSDDPARILAELNRVMRNTLHLRDIDAGLDIAVCMVERSANRLTYAGAGLSLYIVSSGEWQEVRGNHQRIGYKGSKLDYTYNNQILNLTNGACCYLTTDGILDVPGGDKGYGLGGERFKAMIVDQSHFPVPAQAQAFERFLMNYQGENPQRDDITLVGFRL